MKTAHPRRSRSIRRLTLAIGIAVVSLILVVPAGALGSPCHDAKQAAAKAAKAVTKAKIKKAKTAKAVADAADAIVDINTEISRTKLELQNCPPGEPAHTACVNRVNKKLAKLAKQLADAKTKLDEATADDAAADASVAAAEAAKAAADAAVAAIPGCA